MEKVLGWDKLIQIAQKSIPQGLLFLGSEQVQKLELARNFFQLVHCFNPTRFSLKQPCGNCLSCKKVQSGNHPDFVVITSQGEQILVDELREIKKLLYFAPIESAYRFIVIHEAHKLNTSSANSLLKCLEEPPTHTRFILTTHDRSLLLPTVLSRCQFLQFSSETINQNLINKPEGLERLSLQQLADTLGADQTKLQTFLDWMVQRFHDQAIKLSQERAFALAYQTSNQALRANHLSQRLKHYANKKLIALAAAQLYSQTDHLP